jgi:integrase
MEGVRAHRGKIQIDFYLTPDERRRRTLDLDDTPGNLIKAAKLRKKIIDQISAGVFDEAEFFGGVPASSKTFKDMATVWLSTLEGLSTQTVDHYTSAINTHWLPILGDKKLRYLKPSEVVAAVVSREFKSNGTRNNSCIPLRGILHLAFKDGMTERDLSVDIEDKPVTPREPDPFTVQEAYKIISVMLSKEEVIGNLYQLAFYTGMRPSEIIALQWSDIDMKKRRLTVSHVRVYGEDKARTKTGYNRTIDLNAKAHEALTRQRRLTALQGDDVFLAPKTGSPYANEATLREKHWKPALKSLGLEYREPYQTRHSYASWMLMANANLKWVSMQMGHSMQELLKTYGRWIERADQGPVEMKKVEGFIVTNQSPAPTDESQVADLQS